MLSPWPSALVACLLTVPSTTALAFVSAPVGGNGQQTAIAQLLRPSNPPDGNAQGSIRLRSKPNKNDDRFEVDVDQVDTSLDFELYVQDEPDPQNPGSKTFSFVADLEVDVSGQDGSMDWKAWTKKGDALPQGVSNVSDLFGREVEIREGGDVYLRATLPDNPANTGKPQKAISYLVRPDNPPDDDATGDVQLRSQASKGQERFEVNAYEVDEDIVHNLYLEDPKGSGMLVNIGMLDDDDDDDDDSNDDDDDDNEDPDFKLKLDTKQGDSLPLDVDSNDDLLDRRVQIRSAGNVVLRATLPSSWGGPPKNLKAEVQLSTPNPAPIADADGEVKMRQQPFKNRDLFDVFIWDVDDDDTYTLWVETGVNTNVFDQSDSLVKCDDGQQNSDNLRFVTDTLNGEALPFDVASTSDLFGRRVEIMAQGAVVLKGFVPSQYASSSNNKNNVKKRIKLTTANGAPLTNLKGVLRLSSKPNKDDERFEVSVKKLDYGASTWHVFLETQPGNNNFQDVGQLAQLGKSSKGRLRLRTKDGAALPLNAATIHDLADLDLEIRDDQGAVYLVATIPDLKP